MAVMLHDTFNMLIELFRLKICADGESFGNSLWIQKCFYVSTGEAELTREIHQRRGRWVNYCRFLDMAKTCLCICVRVCNFHPFKLHNKAQITIGGTVVWTHFIWLKPFFPLTCLLLFGFVSSEVRFGPTCSSPSRPPSPTASPVPQSWRSVGRPRCYPVAAPDTEPGVWLFV